ncbi:MAG TPA: hypothetical protein VIQ76_11310, partial [Propionibacteriaceae bacterium]
PAQGSHRVGIPPVRHAPARLGPIGQLISRHRRSRSTFVATAQVVAQVCAFLGVVAGFGTSCGSRESPYWQAG